MATEKFTKLDSDGFNALHDSIDALNLDSSSRIAEYYAAKDAEDPLTLREKSKIFRAAYKSWRMQKPKGSLGVITDLSNPSRRAIQGGIPLQAARQNKLAENLGIAKNTTDLAIQTKGRASNQLKRDSFIASSKGQTPISTNKKLSRGRVESSFRHTPRKSVDPSNFRRLSSMNNDEMVDIAYLTFDFEKKIQVPKSELPVCKVDTGGSYCQSLRGSLFKDGKMELLDVEYNSKGWLKFLVNPYSSTTSVETKSVLRLCQENLANMKLIDHIPHYTRKADHWICHIGVGGFHRSHQANYLNTLLEKNFFDMNSSGPNWGLCGVGLMEWDRKMYETLKEQDYLYTLVSRGQSGSSATVIGAIMDYVFAPEDRTAAVEKLADPSTHIVSLTITEKGYCQNVQGNLDTENFLIKHDLEEPELPFSAIGLITQSLKVRKQRGVQPFTVLSCDNLPMNGNKTKKTVLEYCELVDPMLKDWMAKEVCFPNTMVDRITPITQPEHIALCKCDYGVEDGWPVVAEDFSQWVIEDNFTGARPFWEKENGVLVVPDVHSYEWMKLRLLNGTHSALSYPSFLYGFRFVDDSLNDKLIRNFVANYMDEVLPTVPDVPGVDLEEYCESLIQRFSNSYIKDKLLRLAEDGSQKLVTTMKDAMLELVRDEKPVVYISTAIACFIKFMSGYDMEGNPIEGVKDPLLEELKAPCLEAVSGRGDEADVGYVLEMVFGKEVSENDVCVRYISAALRTIVEDGIECLLQSLLENHPKSHK